MLIVSNALIVNSLGLEVRKKVFKSQRDLITNSFKLRWVTGGKTSEVK